MRIYDIITKKKLGLPLSQEEIFYAVNSYMTGETADYQMSALLMAICLKGMNEEETYHLTRVMLESGDTVDLSAFEDLSVDKHSTGGVGDKTTLIVAPIVASLGCKVAKMSGRGLGFTGGTVDKLESINGYRVALSPEDFMKQVKEIGVCVVGQSGNLAPADKKLYALRDVTATIESIPLIASSIMSKKLASGSHNIVLDVKYGSGAFMKTAPEAKALAAAMIKIGEGFGRRVRALVTNMDVPLGCNVGNRLEVWEAIQVLSGKGEKRLTDICVELASAMTEITLSISGERAREMVLDSIKSGLALDKLKDWIALQGGDASFITNPNKLLECNYKKEYLAKAEGYISHIQADSVGKASMLLGAGRAKLGDEIDYTAGICLCKSYGEYVRVGDTIAVLHSAKNDFSSCEKELDSAITVSQEKPLDQPLIFAII